MRKLLQALLAISLATTLATSIAQADETAAKDVRYSISIPDGGIKEFYRWTAGRIPVISAHRGGPMPGYPENAIETFDNATRYGPMVIETDLSLTKDGIIVLMHDKSLDRTTTCNGLIMSYSYNELLKCYLVDNDGKVTSFKVPKLEDALRWAKGKVVLNLDFKKNVPFARVVDAVRRTGAEDSIAFISYTLDQALAMHRAGPELMLNVTMYDDAMLADVKASGLPLNQVIAWVGTRIGDKEFYQRLHGEGFFVSLGTLGRPDRSIDGEIARSGDESRYQRIVDLGVDIVATDRVQQAASVIFNRHIFYFVPAIKAER